MDEPLANLDALLRLEMRVELKHLQKELGQTLVYVTHDQVEAMSMADRIAVLNQGTLQQCDMPDVIYNLPANRFVATVIGSPPTNFITADVRQSTAMTCSSAHPAFTLRAAGAGHPLAAARSDSGKAPCPRRSLVGIRPEDIQVFAARPGKRMRDAGGGVGDRAARRRNHRRPARGARSSSRPSCRRPSDSARARQVWLKFDPDRIHLFDRHLGLRHLHDWAGRAVACLGPFVERLRELRTAPASPAGNMRHGTS